MRYLKKYRIHFILSLILTAISVALTLYVPILVGKAIDLAIGEGLVDIEGIFMILGKIGIAILITAISQWTINILNNKMTYKKYKNVKNISLNTLQKRHLFTV